MVLFTLSKHLTRLIGPPLFRRGVALRNWLAPPLSALPSNEQGIETTSTSTSSTTSNKRTSFTIFNNTTNNYLLDMMFLIPYSQKLLSLAIYDESRRNVTRYYQMKQQQQNKHLGEPSTTTEPSSSSLPLPGLSLPSIPSELSEIRVQVLESIVRPSLLPSNSWSSDIEDGWRYNIRIVAWVRKEFLIAKYGPYIQMALVAYPTLRRSPQIQPTTMGANTRKRILNLLHHGRIDLSPLVGDDTGATDKGGKDQSMMSMLPSSSVVMKAFGMRGWATKKNTQAVREAMVPTVKRLGGYVVRQILPSSSTNNDTAEGEVGTATMTTQQQQQQSSSSSSSASFQYTNHAVIPATADLTDVSLEDILDVVTGGHVATCGPLNALCQEANFYQLWTKEYIEHLGDYLLDRATGTTTVRSTSSSIDNEGDDDDNDNKLVVLDVGAGDGLLIRCLQDYMTRKVATNNDGDITSRKKRRRDAQSSNSTIISDSNRSMPTLVATDDMSWGIFAKATVEKLSVQQALQKYIPLSSNKSDIDKDGNAGQNLAQKGRRRQRVIVLCSWMPMGLDWTALFRDCGVEEYILIGEADDGSCGHNWKTWGNPAFFEDAQEVDDNNNNNISNNNNGEGADRDGPIPPYEMDGYVRWDMDALSQFQFSSFDCSVSKSSKTVSFRKRRHTKPRIQKERNSIHI